MFGRFVEIVRNLKPYRFKTVGLGSLLKMAAAFVLLLVLVVSSYSDKELKDHLFNLGVLSHNKIENKEASKYSNVVLSKASPVKIKIPALDLEAPIVRVGLNRNRSMEVPQDFDKTGWYEKSSIPGQEGSSVIVGHLNSFTGRAVFYDLEKLQPGDRIEVIKNDGSVVVFKVNDKERYSQRSFPWDKVYLNSGTPLLNLVTCDGYYIKDQGSYSHNLVVKASLVEYIP